MGLSVGSDEMCSCLVLLCNSQHFTDRDVPKYESYREVLQISLLPWELLACTSIWEAETGRDYLSVDSVYHLTSTS